MSRPHSRRYTAFLAQSDSETQARSPSFSEQVDQVIALDDAVDLVRPWSVPCAGFAVASFTPPASNFGKVQVVAGLGGMWLHSCSIWAPNASGAVIEVFDAGTVVAVGGGGAVSDVNATKFGSSDELPWSSVTWGWNTQPFSANSWIIRNSVSQKHDGTYDRRMFIPSGKSIQFTANGIAATTFQMQASFVGIPTR